MNGLDFGINVNVAIRKVNKDTGEIKEWEGHNIATKTLNLGIFKFLRGDFNIARSEDNMDDYIPNHLMVGYGDTLADYNNTSLANPLYKDGNTDSTPPYSVGTVLYMQELGSSGYSESTRTVTLPLRFYIPSTDLAGTSSKPTIIKEVGLASKNGNLCARYVLPSADPIEKGENDFVDILWEISVTAVTPA